MFSLYRLLLIIVSMTILSLALPNLVTREGFSYKKCINRGFSSDFCLATPIAGATTNVCRCKDGSDGVTMYGTGARCMCGKELTDEWLQSREPTVYNGSQLQVYPTPSIRDVEDRQNELDARTKDKEKEIKKVNKGRWWYKIEWI